MSTTTVLPMDEDQWRTPVIFGSAANLSSATALSGVASEPNFSGSIKLSETASGVVCDDVVCDAAGDFVAAAWVAALGTAVFPWTCVPHHAPAENKAATATSPITTFNPGRELP